MFIPIHNLFKWSQSLDFISNIEEPGDINKQGKACNKTGIILFKQPLYVHYNHSKLPTQFKDIYL